MLPGPSLRWMAISLVISKARSRDPHGMDLPARLMNEMTRFMICRASGPLGSCLAASSSERKSASLTSALNSSKALPLDLTVTLTAVFAA